MNDSANILVVDDNLNNLRVLISILKTADYHIRPALSGEVALQAMESFTPDLILLDINMSGINGYETCKQLKANERTRDIPVIFISAMRDVDDKLAAFQAGAVDYVTKPFQIEEILARVKTHLELNRAKREVKSLLEARTHELSQNELRLTKLIESAMDAIITLDESLNVVLMNPAAAILFGLPDEAKVGFHVDKIMPERYRQAHSDYLQHFGSDGVTSSVNGLRQFTALRANGEEFPVEASISHVMVKGAKQYTIIMRDISERRRIESALKTSLNEKVSLLNEVHHRVKNNLQVITSLLRLEAGRSVQQQTKNVLNDMQGRIRSMALLHESLYRAGIFASIDLGTYIADLATQGFRAQTSGGGVVRLRLDLASVDVTMDQAMPCGLLINELISNSLKHGFANGRSGEVCVTLSKKSDEPIVMMRVSDNGCGLPADFEAQRGQSLGLQLVADLVSQLGGTMEISSASDLEGGAQFDISFAIDMVKLQTSNVA